jgi:uncharacterized protein YjbI with pentapeptide repeats
MADQAQLRLLHQGKDIWNTWRNIRPATPIDLSGADLGDLNLQGALLQQADLSGSLLFHAQRTHADLSGADLNAANLYQANLSGATFHHANFNGANLSKANLQDTTGHNTMFGGTNAQGASFLRADLSHAAGSEADFSHANFTQAILSNSSFDHTNLNTACLHQTILSGTTFLETSFDQADLSYALLRHANLSGSSFDHTDLSHANLYGTILSYGHLHETRFAHARMGWTILCHLDLRNAQGLETIEHVAPSEISVSTLFRAPHSLPDTFLRGIGIPSSLLETPSFVQDRSFAFKTCFLCFCEHDRTFATLLHTDLQQHGMRCWLAPLEEQTDTFWSFLESIHVYDTLIFVFSRHSITYEDMMARFSTVLKQKPSPAFPVILDDDAKTFYQNNALPLQQVCDFSHWNISEHYNKAQSIFIERFTRNV